MLYRVEFRLDHAPDPIEFDLQLTQKPSEEDILAIVIHKLKPHEPASSARDARTRCRLMEENGLVAVTLFDEKGAALLTL